MCGQDGHTIDDAELTHVDHVFEDDHLLFYSPLCPQILKLNGAIAKGFGPFGLFQTNILASKIRFLDEELRKAPSPVRERAARGALNQAHDAVDAGREPSRALRCFLHCSYDLMGSRDTNK